MPAIIGNDRNLHEEALRPERAQGREDNMELKGIYGAIALSVDVKAGVCATVRALFGAEHSEAAAFARPRELAVELDEPALAAWEAAERYAATLQCALNSREQAEPSCPGRSSDAEASPRRQESALLDEIEASLGHLYSRAACAVRAADPHFFRASSATAWVLCLPDTHFDAPDDRALLGAHGRALLRAGVGTALIVVDDVCELPSMSAALAVGARHLVERDERARLRRRLIAPRGPRDEWGALGAVTRGALAEAWRSTVTQVLDTWKQAVADEAAVRQGAGASPWRRDHDRLSFDPRESAFLVGEQMAEALDERNGTELIERALRAIARWASDIADLAVDIESLTCTLTWDVSLAVDTIRMGDVMKRDYLRALERVTRSLPWPSPCSPAGRIISENALGPWKPRPVEDKLAQALVEARPTLELELVGFGLETVEPAVARIAKLVLDALGFQLNRAIDIGDEGISYTIMHTSIPPMVAIAED